MRSLDFSFTTLKRKWFELGGFKFLIRAEFNFLISIKNNLKTVSHSTQYFFLELKLQTIIFSEKNLINCSLF